MAFGTLSQPDERSGGALGWVPRLSGSDRERVEPRDLPRPSLALLYELERHRGSFEVLLLLYLRGSATKSLMRRWLRPGQEALAGSTACLVQSGLVRCETSRTFPFARTYRLTERGTALVETPLCRWSRVIPPI